MPLGLGIPDETTTEIVADATGAEVTGALDVGQLLALPLGQLVTVLRCVIVLVDSVGLNADAVTLAAWLTIGTRDLWTDFERAGQLLTIRAKLIMVETSVESSVATPSLVEAVQTGAAPLQEVMVL